jgi:hypothetical protein
VRFAERFVRSQVDLRSIRFGCSPKAGMQAGILRRSATSGQATGQSSLSMMEPQKQSAHGPGRNGKCEKPSGFWQPHETHKKQADDNHDSNRVAGPISGSVSSEGNNLGGMRKVVGGGLRNTGRKVH